MIIRTATDNDIKDIAKIYTDSWRRTYKDLLPDSFLEAMTYERSEKKFLSYIHMDKQGAYVAEDGNNEIVGFASFMPYDELEKCLMLDSLHVLKSMQGKGIGKALIFAAGKYAYNNGYEKMALYVAKGNNKAEEIYMHLGAKSIKEFIYDLEGIPLHSIAMLWNDITCFP